MEKRILFASWYEVVQLNSCFRSIRPDWFSASPKETCLKLANTEFCKEFPTECDHILDFLPVFRTSAISTYSILPFWKSYSNQQIVFFPNDALNGNFMVAPSNKDAHASPSLTRQWQRQRRLKQFSSDTVPMPSLKVKRLQAVF